MIKILAAAQDAGAANVLTPVLRELSRLSAFEVRTLAASHASRIFTKNALAHEAPPVWSGTLAQAQEWARSIFDTFEPDLLLLGTAWGISLDKWLLQWAQERQTPSLALIDHWCHYRERFLEPSTQILRLPSRVGVMDPFALEQSVKAGIPKDRLVVTGQPYLEELAAQAKESALRNQAQALRQEWLKQTPGAARIILFASERYPENPGFMVSTFPKYTESQALEGLIQALKKLGKSPQQTRVIVKLHPKEAMGSFELGGLAREWNTQVVGGLSAWPCILAADLVVGMTSMILLETALIKKAAVSFQPDVVKDSPFVGTELGIVPTASNPEELAALLDKAFRANFGPVPLAGKEQRILDSLSMGNSLSRILHVLFELAQGRTAAGISAGRLS